MSFFSSGDGARFAALGAAPFHERFANFPTRMSVDVWSAIVELSGELPEYGLSKEVVSIHDGEVILDGKASDLITHACLEQCGVERWKGNFCYGDLTTVFETLDVTAFTEPERAAWKLLSGTLQQTGTPEPWWLTARFSQNRPYGFLNPPRVAALAESLSQTKVAEKATQSLSAAGHYAANDLPEISNFFIRAATRHDYVLGVEWT